MTVLVSHMLNPHGTTPHQARFLQELAFQERRVHWTWSWGGLEVLPFLSRVRHHRTVLAPARWRPNATLRGDSAAAGRAARALVSVCAPVQGARGPVPGWWAGHSPGTDADAYPEGHLNLGLAHGAPGILAFLALAWRQGCRVDGQ
ncbi:lantibiotic dehydratase [Streptomyces triculaminicus]|uniref:lantibiotic dehydratase n=1 Tax=Streptomyces triculaminicus TaxID=2816232 RepID=UPI0037D2C328